MDISALKARIEDGTYEIPVEAVADAICELFLRPRGAEASAPDEPGPEPIEA